MAENQEITIFPRVHYEELALKGNADVTIVGTLRDSYIEVEGRKILIKDLHPECKSWESKPVEVRGMVIDKTTLKFKSGNELEVSFDLDQYYQSVKLWNELSALCT